MKKVLQFIFVLFICLLVTRCFDRGWGPGGGRYKENSKLYQTHHPERKYVLD
ncbi:MAG: hypothetical protein P4L42_01645 [Desulfocapsaceae bacterium]|nr:hypothetical protein [Desulfocapsaceae bacterium]